MINVFADALSPAWDGRFVYVTSFTATNGTLTYLDFHVLERCSREGVGGMQPKPEQEPAPSKAGGLLTAPS